MSTSIKYNTGLYNCLIIIIYKFRGNINHKVQIYNVNTIIVSNYDNILKVTNTTLRFQNMSCQRTLRSLPKNTFTGICVVLNIESGTKDYFLNCCTNIHGPTSWTII